VKTHAEKIQAHVMAGAALVHARNLSEGIDAGGLYTVSSWRPAPARLDEFIALRDTLARLMASPSVRFSALAEIEAIRARLDQIPRDLVFEDTFHNTVVTEGKNAILTHFLKGSSYTASQVLALIEDTGYSAIAAGNTAGSITAVGGGSPANGWNEAPVGTCAARQTPSGSVDRIESGPAFEAMDRVQDPGGGRARLQYDYGRLMWVTGEGVLFAIEQGPNTGTWRFL